jgi:DNA-binding SARP family transcriptional activator/tetratricopeptide (TPR) repeat protein
VLDHAGAALAGSAGVAGGDRPVTWRVLGPVEVSVDGAVLPIRRPQQRGVLAYLALNANLVVSTDQLVGAMWGDTPTPTARTQLQVCVSQIRRYLRAVGADRCIVSESGGYRLIAAADTVDVALFHHQVASARSRDAGEAAELLRRAVALWRGEPLAGAAGAFVATAAAGLDEQRLRVHEELAGIELALGRPEPVVSALQPVVAAQPLRERLVARFMLALADSGQQAAALRLYHDTRQRLADELGVEPGAELGEAYLAILRRNRPAVPAVPRGPAPQASPAQLPLDVASFTGRDGALHALDDMLSPGPTAVICIDGMPGVGKTTLAVHWAHRVAGRFRDGQLYVNLRGFGPGGPATDPTQVVRGFLDALGVPARSIPADPEGQVNLYRSVLAGKRILVVLDNARDAEQVRPLLPGAPGCAAIVTSRRRLTSLVAIEGARAFALPPLTVDESPEMLTRRLGADRVAAEPDAVRQITDVCGGLPLALAIVAARAAAQPNAPLARVAARLGGLDAFRAGDAATDVGAVFSWSYDAISGPAAALFRLLGLHVGGDIAVEAAASLHGSPVDRAAALLDELVEAHLVAEHRPGRYAMHDLLRAYATELADRVDGGAAREAAVERLLEHYAQTAARADRLIDPHEAEAVPEPVPPDVTVTEVDSHQRALAWFDDEWPALIAAVEVATRSARDPHVQRLTAPVREYLARRGHWPHLVANQRAALAAAERLADRPAQARTHADLARAYAYLGGYREAQDHLRRALSLFDDMSDVAGQASTHLKLGGLLGMRGRHREALRHARTALDQFQAVGHEGGYARALNNLGWYHAQLGDHRTTLRCCKQALILHRRLGDRRGQADTWDSLGYAHHHLGHPDQAVAPYRRALAIYRDIGDRAGQAHTLSRLGDARLALGDHGRARTAWRRALDILGELGHSDAEVVEGKLRSLGDRAPNRPPDRSPST